MANVSSVSDIKKAIQNKEKVLVATNKKTKLILLAASKLPATAFAASKMAAVGRSATLAINTAAGLMALTTGQVWALIISGVAIVGLISIIGILRAEKARIVVESGTKRFIVEYEGMGK